MSRTRRTILAVIVVSLLISGVAIGQALDPRTELQAAQIDIDQAQALQVQEDAELASAEAHLQAALAALPTGTTGTTAPTTSTSTTAPTTTATTAVPTTTSTTVAPTTTATTAPPTTTTATVPPTTTTTVAPGSYGTPGTGPTLEPCTTTGTVVTSTAAVTSGPQNSIILLRGATYATGFTVPQGSTVKPYNCEVVQINDNINVNNNSTVAGLFVAANSDGWALRITGRTNVEIRNAVIKGGTTEAIRVDGASVNVRFIGVHIDGGVNNHSMKIRCTGSGSSCTSAAPTNILIRNVLFTKTYFGGGEDLLQLEGHGMVTIERTTFRDNPSGEDGLDVKSTFGPSVGLSITGSLFEGGNINAECLLIQGNLQPTVVSGNQIDNCFASLGAHPEANQNPSWDFFNNLMSNGAVLRLRRSFDTEMRGNVWPSGGRVILGTSTSGDYPRNAFFSTNSFGSASWEPQPAANFICDGTNTGTGGAGSACS